MEDLTFCVLRRDEILDQKVGEGRPLERVAELQALGLGGIQNLFHLKRSRSEPRGEKGILRRAFGGHVQEGGPFESDKLRIGITEGAALIEKGEGGGDRTRSRPCRAN